MIASLIALSMATATADCRLMGRYLHIRFSQPVARPGDRVEVSFEYRDGDGGFKPVPLYCVERMQVVGRAALERNYVVRITGDAMPGSTVSVAVQVGGIRSAADIDVVGPDQPVGRIGG
jgi:hypothetical protein